MKKRASRITKAYYAICFFLLIMLIIFIGAHLAYENCLNNIPPNYGITTNCEKGCYCDSTRNATDLWITIASLGAICAALVGIIMIVRSTIRSKTKWPPQKEQIIFCIALVLMLISYFVICPMLLEFILG